MRELKAIHSQEAWEGINKAIFLGEKQLKEEGEGRDGNSSLSYDNLITITKAWVDPEFDFGKVFGYTMSKWTHLVNNYVDKNYLDIVKVEVGERERKKQRHYSITKHFGNGHENGKDCLIAVTFSRRITSDIPILVVNTRATEITKRLLMDLVLIQRIGEYVYGVKQTFSIILYAPMAYLHMESFCMYHSHKNIKKMLGHEAQPFQMSIEKCLDLFLNGDPMKIKYLSSRRISQHLQGLTKPKPLLTKDLKLEYPKYPIEAFTDKQRRAHKKSIKK